MSRTAAMDMVLSIARGARRAMADFFAALKRSDIYRVRGAYVVVVLILALIAPSITRGADNTAAIPEAAKPLVQTGVVRTTGGVDTTGWVLIAVVHGLDAAVVREGQQVRAFSVNSRRRMHLARVTRVTRQQSGVRVEATLAARVLGTSTRYLLEIVTESI